MGTFNHLAFKKHKVNINHVLSFSNNKQTSFNLEFLNADPDPGGTKVFESKTIFHTKLTWKYKICFVVFSVL